MKQLSKCCRKKINIYQNYILDPHLPTGVYFTCSYCGEECDIFEEGNNTKKYKERETLLYGPFGIK